MRNKNEYLLVLYREKMCRISSFEFSLEWRQISRYKNTNRTYTVGKRTALTRSVDKSTSLVRPKPKEQQQLSGPSKERWRMRKKEQTRNWNEKKEFLFQESTHTHRVCLCGCRVSVCVWKVTLYGLIHFVALCHKHSHAHHVYSFSCVCFTHVMRRATLPRACQCENQQQIANDIIFFPSSSSSSFPFVRFVFSFLCVGKTWMLAPDQSHSLDIVLSGDSLFELSLWWGCVFFSLRMPFIVYISIIIDWRLSFRYSSLFVVGKKF